MRPRLIVLGAGASIPYGFPDGRTLITDVAEYIPHDKANLAKLFSTTKREDEVLPIIEELAKRLKNPYVNSIDRFLANHPTNEIYKTVGEYGILSRIANYEKRFLQGSLLKFDSNNSIPGIRYDGIRDWMEHLFQKMFEHAEHNLEEFRRIPFNFVSFNYDRLFEYKLALAIYGNYPYTLEESMELANGYCQDHLIHVHGSIGNIQTKPFGTEVDPNAFNIKLVHQEFTPDDRRILEKWLSEASQVVFLGFGYHKENIRKLAFQNIGEKKAYGTFMGLGDAEIMDATTQMQNRNNFVFDDFRGSLDCLGFLKNYINFWDY